MYAIILRDPGVNGTVVENTFFVNSFPAKILFDSGASHSFISLSFMRRLHLMPDNLDIPLSVASPLGDCSILEFVCRGCAISLDDVQFMVDLIVLVMSAFDVIMGMDWLSTYHEKINYFA